MSSGEFNGRFRSQTGEEDQPASTVVRIAEPRLLPLSPDGISLTS